MPKKKAAELGALQMSRLLKPGTHAVGAVVGLKLKINDAGAWSWVLRATVAGKNRDMRLGGFPDMTPAQARDKGKQPMNHALVRSVGADARRDGYASPSSMFQGSSAS
jgi:hypothetical protein